MENFDVIIPIAAKDYETVIQTIPYIEKYIKPNKIVVISSLTGGGTS